MEGEGDPGNSEPDTEGEVADHSLDKEALGTTVHEMEEPLLGGVRSVMPDVTTGIGRLLVEVLLTVPGSPLLLWHAEALSVRKSHVLCVSVLIMSKSTSYTLAKNKLSFWGAILTFDVHNVLYLII